MKSQICFHTVLWFSVFVGEDILKKLCIQFQSVRTLCKAIKCRVYVSLGIVAVDSDVSGGNDIAVRQCDRSCRLTFSQ